MKRLRCCGLECFEYGKPNIKYEDPVLEQILEIFLCKYHLKFFLKKNKIQINGDK